MFRTENSHNRLHVVLFADIVGFTAWSANRQPSEVFQLLETIYGAFDVAARARNVFKVETIGDCYGRFHLMFLLFSLLFGSTLPCFSHPSPTNYSSVAVAGLPRPQKFHAVIMVKFADECRRELSTELQNLAPTLGAETLKLQLRIGLHTGSVTAGVLRGDKARFQLFGDSMNTASR